jgi:hypothetical protein
VAVCALSHVALLVVITAGQPPKGPAFADLANYTYDFGPEDKRTVTLKDGKGKDADESIFELLKVHAIGDLDGDKQPDAAAMLVESSGGSGHFYYLFVLLNRGGTLVQIPYPEWLGDRSVIQRITINKGVLAVRFITHKPEDPSCCPTRQVENRYRVVNGKLLGLR